MTLSTLFISLAFILVPLVVIFKQELQQSGIGFVFLAVMSVSLFLLVAIFYSNKKGDLSWLKTFMREKVEEPKGGFLES